MASNGKTSTPVGPNTRGRKGSLKEKEKELVTLDDITTLLNTSEENIKKFFKDEIGLLLTKILKLEGSLSSAKAECSRLDTEMTKMKAVIVDQQQLIEKHEAKLRSDNLIIHNLPESRLADDIVNAEKDKLNTIFRTANLKTNPGDIVSFFRLGKPRNDRPRPIKVTLRNADLKFALLNKRKMISSCSDLRRQFNSKIFINADSSFLVRKEEFRLRQELTRLKSNKPGSVCFIRSGSLFVDGLVHDKIDVSNQLF